MDRSLPIPTRPQELTTAWLSSALQPLSSKRDLAVRAFRCAPLDDSKGFYGEVVRIHLSYTGAADEVAHWPRTLIAKFSSANIEMRRRSIDSYAREVGFYQKLVPQTPLPTATCYYAGIDLESAFHILLLQDLAPAHSRSRAAGCTPLQAQEAIDHIAQLHIRWWGKSEANELVWLHEENPPTDAALMQQQYEQWWSIFYQHARAQMTEEVARWSEELGKARAYLRTHLFHSPPRTLIHRDFQLDNLFLAPFAILDWQFLSRGLGIWDVAYFLSESLLPTDRRLCEREVLARYHHTLCERGINDYPFERCLRDYRLCLLQRHTALVSTIAAMPFSDEQRAVHVNILLPRNIAAILDHQAHTLLL